LVLDTNIVLDWLVFRDASMNGLRRALSEQRLQLITHQPALDELRRVLAYPQCKLAAPEQLEILQHYQSVTTLATLPDGFGLHNLLLPAGFPSCRDPDDEHFLALAYHVGACSLVTRDKAILRLRKRVQKFGVTLLAPLQLPATL
jgi:putative PIN family toxin of toxin-antitoxin system